ncbi:MAG TPA: AI-2E family transporter [Parafilimonas sp.]|nr:AI-2E family transporter [Parafilimonas sp.]
MHAFVILLLLAYFGKFLFIPLFFSFLIAIFLYPVCSWFEHHGLNRLASCILCVVICILLCSVIIYFVSSQFQRFLKDIPFLEDKLNEWLQNFQQWVRRHYRLNGGTQVNYIDRYMDALSGAAGFTFNSFISVLLFATLSVFFIFYILFYRKELNNFLLSLFKASFRKKITEISYVIHETIVNYIKGLLTEMFILIFLSAVTLLILGIKYAILMAFIAGVFNIVPYIGIYTATLLNMLIAIASGNDGKSLEVLLVFVIIHIIDSNLITPIVVGNRIKINPFLTLVAVVAGKLVWGIPGMFLFIPLAGIIHVVIEKFAGMRSSEILA